MAAYNKFYPFMNSIMAATAPLNLNVDTLALSLTNVAPGATMAKHADVTEIAGTNGYTTNGQTLSGQSANASTATFVFSANGIQWTGSTVTGSSGMGPFQYVVLWDSQSASLTSGPLIAWWDYGTAITLNTGDTFLWKPNGSTAGSTIFTMT